MKRWWWNALLVATLACAPQDDEDAQDGSDEGGDRFPCGGGSCAVGTELCLVDDSDGCTICEPMPAACDPMVSCGCVPPANDPTFGMSGCTDVGQCERVDGGLVITCEEGANWGCG